MTAPNYEYSLEGKIFRGNVPLVMGTRFDIIVIGEDEDKVLEFWRLCTEILEKCERRMNRFDPESEVSEVNRELSSGLAVTLGDEMRQAVAECIEFRDRTGGYFDIAGNPDAGLELDGNVLKPSVQGVSLDFGGFAKGFALRKIADVLKDKNVKNAFVDFGDSSVYAVGAHPCGDCWPVSLPSPFTGQVIADFRLKDNALSTSGNTPGYTGHIIDPHTGKACCARRIACVVSEDPLEAEILSTALMVADDAAVNNIRTNFPDTEMKIFNLN